MKRPRTESIEDLNKINPPKKHCKSSPTVIDLQTSTDSLPYIDVNSEKPIKVYHYIFDINKLLKNNKVSKLHCDEDIMDIQWSSTESSDYMSDIPSYTDFDYEYDGQGSDYDQKSDETATTESYHSDTDWSFDYLNDD